MKEIVIKTETKSLHCPECGSDIKVISKVMGDKKYHHYEFKNYMMKKFERRENLYLRDTSKYFTDAYPYCDEIIRVLYFNKTVNSYVIIKDLALQPIPVEDSFIMSLISGKEKENGLELVDIYGNTN